MATLHPRCRPLLALAFVVAASAPLVARAHFELLSPDSWRTQDALGSPQKVGPCGEEGLAPTTGAVTTFSYSSNNGPVLLTNVADVDGRNTTFVYTNNGYYSNASSRRWWPSWNGKWTRRRLKSTPNARIKPSSANAPIGRYIGAVGIRAGRRAGAGAAPGRMSAGSQS